MSDLIDRQAAIDALKNDMASLDHIIQGMSGYDVRLDAYVSQRNQVNCDIDTISNLPPAQPEPCEDAVSRKAVIDATDEWKEACADSGHKETVSDIKLIRKDFIELPPVTPKQRTGKWIDGIIPNDSGGLPVIVCDQCNTFFPLQFGDGHNFCPNCGAKMEGSAE